jgi:outer membrane protein OmpA-like peptidoglycan-associated protein
MKYVWLKRAGVLCLLGGTVDLWALNDLVLPELYRQALPLPRVSVAHAAAAKVEQTPSPPSTPAEPAIQEQFEPVIVLEFEMNSHRVGRAALGSLGAVVEELGDARRIAVVGHADATGPEEFNELLSQARAESVARSLRQLGIARERLDVAWHGERRPRGEGDDKRVEIYLGEAP